MAATFGQENKKYEYDESELETTRIVILSLVDKQCTIILVFILGFSLDYLFGDLFP